MKHINMTIAIYKLLCSSYVCAWLWMSRRQRVVHELCSLGCMASAVTMASMDLSKNIVTSANRTQEPRRLLINAQSTKSTAMIFMKMILCKTSNESHLVVSGSCCIDESTQVSRDSTSREWYCKHSSQDNKPNRDLKAAGCATIMGCCKQWLSTRTAESRSTLCTSGRSGRHEQCENQTVPIKDEHQPAGETPCVEATAATTFTQPSADAGPCLRRVDMGTRAHSHRLGRAEPSSAYLPRPVDPTPLATAPASPPIPPNKPLIDARLLRWKETKQRASSTHSSAQVKPPLERWWRAATKVREGHGLTKE